MVPMKTPTMLYRKGTTERIHGVHVDWTIVDEHEVEDYLTQGWFRTPAEADAGEHADEGERRAAAERAEHERAEAERRVSEDAARAAALDEREKRLAAMQEELDRKLADLNAAASKKSDSKGDKPTADK